MPWVPREEIVVNLHLRQQSKELLHRLREDRISAMTRESVNRDAQHATSTLQTHDTNRWGILEAAVVGAVWYIASIFLLDLSMFGVYSTPSLRSDLSFYQLDTHLPIFAGVLGGILFAGPLVMWIIRKRRFGSLPRSIEWACSNRVFGWASLAGLALGIGYSFAKSALVGQGYQVQSLGYITAFVLITGLAVATEEVYFRGILFVALADKVGKIPSIVIVTLLFALLHPRHFLTVLPIAILLGGMRLYWGSVRACFACHTAYNLSLVLFMLPIKPLSLDPNWDRCYKIAVLPMSGGLGPDSSESHYKPRPPGKPEFPASF
jgi:membrane protease YdiL (CAAX protease family)